MAGGRGADTPVAVVHWGTTDRQQVVRATLGEPGRRRPARAGRHRHRAGGRPRPGLDRRGSGPAGDRGTRWPADRWWSPAPGPRPPTLVDRLDRPGRLGRRAPGDRRRRPGRRGAALAGAAHRLVAGAYQWVAVTSSNAVSRWWPPSTDRTGAVDGAVGGGGIGHGPGHGRGRRGGRPGARRYRCPRRWPRPSPRWPPTGPAVGDGAVPPGRDGGGRAGRRAPGQGMAGRRGGGLPHGGRRSRLPRPWPRPAGPTPSPSPRRPPSTGPSSCSGPTGSRRWWCPSARSPRARPGPPASRSPPRPAPHHRRTGGGGGGRPGRGGGRPAWPGRRRTTAVTGAQHRTVAAGRLGGGLRSHPVA